jgi:iron complex transport system substrate-binding protein
MKKLLILILLSLQLFAYDRIIALSPSINEIIYALNSGDKIVGNTDFCNYPKDAKTKPKVGGFFSPNLEKIIALKPDMVIMQTSSLKLSKKLKRLGIKTTIIKNRTIDDIKNSIKIIGNVLNKKDKANKIVQNIDSKLSHLKNIIKDKKILIVIGHNTSLDKRIFVAGQNLYFDDIINLSGNKNAYQSTLKGQPVLNLENIIATNPDIVILLSPYRIKKGLSKKKLITLWINIPINAKKQKNIYIVDGEYAGIPSQRIIHFLDDFKSFLEDVRSKKL